jgi:hypothetical protein
MPPQVGRAGEGPQPVVTQQPGEVNQPKAGEVKTKLTESNKSQEDPIATAKTVQSFRQGSTELGRQKKAQGEFVQKKLQDQIPVNKKSASATVDVSGLKNGESISAKAKSQQDGFHFEFNRPITKEQAASIIFQNGKVPDGAKLVQGSGNSWVVQVANDLDARNNVTRHYNSHTETVTTPPRKASDVYAPDSELTFTWTGGAVKTSGTQRRDLKNDMGFTIKNQYRLDEGQRSTHTLGLTGMGYEFGFDKPMTKAEVMEKLFDKEKITQGGEVRLVPATPEPTKQWKVEAIGLDAVTAFKRDAQHAITDANVFGKQSLPSDTPAGIRSHIENKTVPKNATKHEPDVYVWEQDGYMMYVKTNNKGKDGYYEPEMTKMPTDNQGQVWMRYYMQEHGQPPREAWQNFWKDTVDEVRMKLAMINSAARMPQPLRSAPPKSSFEDAPNTSGRMTRTSVPRQTKMNVETTEPPTASGGKINEVPSGVTKTVKSIGTHNPREDAITLEKDLAKGKRLGEVKENRSNINRMASSDKDQLTIKEREVLQKEISDRATIRKDLTRRGADVLEAEGIPHVASNHKNVAAGLRRIAGDSHSPRQAEAQNLLNQIEEQTERINHLSGVMAKPQRPTLK